MSWVKRLICHCEPKKRSEPAVSEPKRWSCEWCGNVAYTSEDYYNHRDTEHPDWAVER